MILILGGTAEARELATRLHEAGTQVITSLAGRVARPRLPAGETRIGGFGGPGRLADWIRLNGVTAIVDATHPFAERISASAAAAAEASRRPLLRLERPGWSERPGDAWTWVPDLERAAAAIAPQQRVFLTSGRQGLPAFASCEAWFLIRTVDPPEAPLPHNHELILNRGPYTLAGETELLRRHRIDLLVTKDSGGEHTVAKLDAARALRVPVLIVRRPPRPAVEATASVDAAAAWARAASGGDSWPVRPQIDTGQSG
jgi:precorrin-6A/cobalt-precorrin-6A reductase